MKKLEEVLKFSKADLPTNVADIAKGTSHVPERRAESYREWYIDLLNTQWDFICKHVTNEESQENFASDLIHDFKDRLLRKLADNINARCNCISTMITGPARFPVKKANRANDRERSTGEAITELIEKSEKYIVKALMNALPDSVKTSQAAANMIMRLKRDFGYYGENSNNAHWIRPISKGRISTFIKNNNKEALRVVLQFINDSQKDMKKPLWTKRNGIFKEFEDALNAPDVEEELETTVIFDHDFVRIENNREAERVQLFFDGKPSDDVRAILKSKAFRFSPTNEAWQRKNTNNGIYAARGILHKFKEMGLCQ